MDIFDAAKLVAGTFDVNYSDASTAVHHELDYQREDSKSNRVRETNKQYTRICNEVIEDVQNVWTTDKNPVLQFLPEGMTAEQARTIAHLVVSRRMTPLYLALLVYAKKVGGK